MELKNIRLDKALQPRASINEGVVSEYKELMEDGVKFPPLTVFHDSVYYWLVDGYHRYFAAKKLGLTEFEVDVKKGTRREAQLYSFGVNDHGLTRTSEDKRKAVLAMLDDLEWNGWSDVEIAKQCKVSRQFVAKVRASVGKKLEEVKYINKHGQEAVMKVGKKNEVESEVQILKPLSEMEDDIPEITEEDRISELASFNQELAEENARLHDQLLIVEMTEDQQKIEDQFAELRTTIKQLEAELRTARSSRDQFQAKSAELMKQVAYWRKRAEKAEKAAA
jgi:uncharacterized protein YnzC (UPF0291/DUF896 family)